MLSSLCRNCNHHRFSPTCVFGGRDVIAKSNAGFNVIDLLG